MLVGYEPEDATFEVSVDFMRPIPCHRGTGGGGTGGGGSRPFASLSAVAAGLAVLAWNYEDDFVDAAVVRVDEHGKAAWRLTRPEARSRNGDRKTAVRE